MLRSVPINHKCWIRTLLARRFLIISYEGQYTGNGLQITEVKTGSGLVVHNAKERKNIRNFT